MADKTTPTPKNSAKNRKAKDPVKKTAVKPPAAVADPAAGLLETLDRHGRLQGLTCREMLDKCGAACRRGLALKLKLADGKPGASHVQAFVYDLWTKGLVFSEPPRKGKRVGRIWPMDVARIKFPLLFAPEDQRKNHAESITKERLKAAYDKFVPEHLGGFVPIYKVRRELAGSKDELDKILRELNEMDDPVLELLGGDPRKFTEDQKQDSLWRGENLFLRMRWRRP
ncbi:MAG: hypothetical protein V2B18_23430 [Pseudomonadota bacterium]